MHVKLEPEGVVFVPLSSSHRNRGTYHAVFGGEIKSIQIPNTSCRALQLQSPASEGLHEPV